MEKNFFCLLGRFEKELLGGVKLNFEIRVVILDDVKGIVDVYIVGEEFLGFFVCERYFCGGFWMSVEMCVVYINVFFFEG